MFFVFGTTHNFFYLVCYITLIFYYSIVAIQGKRKQKQPITRQQKQTKMVYWACGEQNEGWKPAEGTQGRYWSWTHRKEGKIRKTRWKAVEEEGNVQEFREGSTSATRKMVVEEKVYKGKWKGR